MTVRTPDELAAVIPHLLGFTPERSLVVLATTSENRTMLARVDLPLTDLDREQTSAQLVEALAVSVARRRDADSAPPLLSVAYSDDQTAADRASGHLAAALATAGIETTSRLWVDGGQWVDLTTGASGQCREETATRVAAERVADGRRLPLDSRATLAASFTGDPRAVAAELPAARLRAGDRGGTAERPWLLSRVLRHTRDGVQLSNADAARVLVAVDHVGARDAALFLINRDNAAEHQALWADLTRRAPGEVRTPAATLAAFASWQHGDGAAAWCALDRIPPEHRDYPLAQLVAQVLEEAVDPSAWDAHAVRSGFEENNPTGDPPGALRGAAASRRDTLRPSQSHRSRLDPPPPVR